MASKEGESLHILAEHFTKNGHYLQAIKCHTALCLGGKEVPVVEARSQLALAKLLLQHTHNAAEARSHLERALLLLGRSQQYLGVRCEVASELARCQGCMGDVRQQKQTLAKALEFCQSASSTINGPEQHAWELHFLFELATCAARSGDMAAALEHMDRASNCASATEADVQVLVALYKAQLLASSGKRGEALQALDSSVEQVTGFEEGTPRVAHLRLHFALLRTLCQLAAGETGSLQQTTDEGMPVILELEALMAEVAPDEPWSYRWLPASAVCAAACLACACVLRPGGKLKDALKYLERGQCYIENELRAQRTDIQAGEAALAAMARDDVQALLTVLFLFIETAALIQMTQSELAGAQKLILLLMQLLKGFPGLLRRLVPSMHMLAGHYAHVHGLFTRAAAHFAAAATGNAFNGDCGGGTLAALNQALAVLCEGGPGALVRATEILKKHSLYDSISSGLPANERAAGLLVSGQVLLAQGDDHGGRLRLSKALKLAHNRLSNHSLVSQALNSLAPAQLATSDAVGAESMLKSSFTLAKNLHDLSSQVQSLAELHRLHTATAAAEAAEDSRAYLTRKQQDLARTQQAAAAAATDHAAILGWGLE
ncbi:g9293 [Coccomyxa elongata]